MRRQRDAAPDPRSSRAQSRDRRKGTSVSTFACPEPNLSPSSSEEGLGWWRCESIARVSEKRWNGDVGMKTQTQRSEERNHPNPSFEKEGLKNYARGGECLRHCEERSDAAIQCGTRRSGLLRYARNDDQVLAVRPEPVEGSLPTANCPSTSSGRTGGSAGKLGPRLLGEDNHVTKQQPRTNHAHPHPRSPHQLYRRPQGPRSRCAGTHCHRSLAHRLRTAPSHQRRHPHRARRCRQ